jgi:hypothetical protein
MLVGIRLRSHIALTRWILAGSVIAGAACKNWLDPCATSLVVRPSRASVLVDSSLTFQALVIGGCGLVPTGPAVRAVWHSENPTIAQVSPPTSDAQVTVKGLRPGETAIVASGADLTGHAYVLVK